ncbi:MAG: alpha/beta hydrolase fold domain-containing protein [Flavobacteriaceae bacterium]|nr:alpha/beta hydrolase fold domain-containing protein [Flavobacteriaceae bacterium]
MKIVKNIPVSGKHHKPILTDLFYLENKKAKDIVIFCHGYKGYKDWGAWNLVAEIFAKQNLFFVKMNFSHNGGTIQQPIDFPDLEAFGNNNFTLELDDISSVLDWLEKDKNIQKEINLNQITLIGHSRGGGIVLIKASEDPRIKKVITWSSVSDFGSRFPNETQLKSWKENGVAYITNARTHQQMPHYFQFYTNFKENESRLNIKSAVEKLNIPYLIIHGTKDETVPIQEANKINSWNPKSQLQLIEFANHSFGSKQPWKPDNLPQDLNKVVQKTLQFLV